MLSDMSCQPCGCDKGCGDYKCERHRVVVETASYSEPLTVPTTSGSSQSVSGEVRVVDPLTGGEKGSKIERFDLIPEEMESALARHYGVGATKYADRNWERGYKWGLSYSALRRHLAAWVRGESYDPETGSHHLVAVIWHATALLVFELRGLGTDDIRRK
jgi:hypothetical protein